MSLDVQKRALINLIKKRQREGYNILYTQYAAVLYGVIRHMVSDVSLANDLLQDTFIHIWEKIEEYDESRCTFFVWMLNVARTISINASPRGRLTGLDGEAVLQGEVIKMAFLYGLSYQEIASKANVDVGEVKEIVRKGYK